MQITFTNLPPGNYRLWARAKDLDNTYLEAIGLLDIKASPPWWKSWLAYLAYILVTGAVAGWFVQLHLRRQLAKKEAENLRTLDKFKNKLFANISHEFRTPLTIISGMIEQTPAPAIRSVAAAARPPSRAGRKLPPPAVTASARRTVRRFTVGRIGFVMAFTFRS